MRRKSTAATTGSRARCCARSSCGSGRTPPDPFFGNASNLPQRLPARPEIAEQIGRHLAHLNLFRALCDAVAAMVAIAVLERLVPRIADPAMDLHRAVGRLADAAVRPLVAHADLFPQGAPDPLQIGQT